MKQCQNCNQTEEDHASKFCKNCGSKLPENNKLEENQNSIIGDKNIISGDITGTKITGGNVSYTTVNHAQDDTKKRVRCFYTGQGVSLEDLMNCPSCKKDVSKAYYNYDNRRCYHCDDNATNEYKQLMRDYLLDGRLDIAEIKELQLHQKRLLLSDEATQEIEQIEKDRVAFARSTNITQKELRELDDLAKLFEYNKHIKEAESIISILFKKYPQIPEVSFFYYLNEFDKKGNNLYDKALEIKEDDIFAYYFGGVAAILEGKITQSQEIIEKVSLSYEDYFYLNDALKLLSLVEKFDYQTHPLITDKTNLLLAEIDVSNFKGIHLSAYLGILSYVDNYCCGGKFASNIAKHSDSVSVSLGYLFINLREKKLLTEKRKIDTQIQAEQERIELKKLEKKIAEEKAKAEALRIEQEKKEKLEREINEKKNALEKAKTEALKVENERNKEIEYYKKIQLEKYKEEKIKEQIKKRERRREVFNSIARWFLEKDSKGESSRLYITVFLLFLIFFFSFWIIPGNIKKKNEEKEALTLSSSLEKKYEKINLLIINNQLDSAKILLPSLVHPSDLSSPYKQDGLLSDNYKYIEYWKIKREELTKKIEEKKSPLSFNENKPKNSSKNNLNIKTKQFYNLNENSLNEYGYVELLDQINGEQIIDIYLEDKFELLEKGQDWSKIKLSDGQIGYIETAKILFN